MKVGDMVVRAYAFRAFIPGIVVDQETEIIGPDDDDEGFEPYEQFNFIVQWSDGAQTSEMYEELDYLEDALQFEMDNENR